MRYLILLIAITLLSILIVSIYEVDSVICYSDEPISHGNRFSHCDKGNIITVTTMPLLLPAGAFDSYDDTERGLMHINEVSSYCSFDYEIIKIGSGTIRDAVHRDKLLPLEIFTCRYSGEDRGSKFATEL